MNKCLYCEYSYPQPKAYWYTCGLSHDEYAQCRKNQCKIAIERMMEYNKIRSEKSKEEVQDENILC